MDTITVVEPLDEPLGPLDDDADDADDARAALLERSALWDSAVMDRDERLARQVLHPGFALEIVQPVPSVMSRDTWLELLADYVVHEWEVEAQVVDLDGDYAAVLQRVRMRASVIGEDRSGIVVLSDLWRRVDAEWLVWRRHSTTHSPLP